jgi:hypothetical protein
MRAEMQVLFLRIFGFLVWLMLAVPVVAQQAIINLPSADITPRQALPHERVIC